MKNKEGPPPTTLSGKQQGRLKRQRNRFFLLTQESLLAELELGGKRGRRAWGWGLFNLLLLRGGKENALLSVLG